jgi:uncharacterized protein YijF (DUF1287 family)
VAAIRAGDLVSWRSGERTKVGVVKCVHEDGSCTVDYTTTAGRFEERISSGRLQRITSTVEPAGVEE